MFMYYLYNLFTNLQMLEICVYLIIFKIISITVILFYKHKIIICIINWIDLIVLEMNTFILNINLRALNVILN